MIQQTIKFQEGNLYLDAVIKGQLYSACIELPTLGSPQEEELFAEKIANLVKNTMLKIKGTTRENIIPMVR